MTSTPCPRTFTAEGQTFTTTAKTRFAVVLTCSDGVYDSEKDYNVIGSEAGAVVIAKRTSNHAAAVKALARFAAQTGFVSGTIADTYEI